MLSTAVPPPSLSDLSFTRVIVAAVDQRVQNDLEQQEKELSEKLHNATVEQITLKVNTDIDALKQRIPTKEVEAVEAAKDQRYLKERQLKLIVQLVLIYFTLC